MKKKIVDLTYKEIYNICDKSINNEKKWCIYSMKHVTSNKKSVFGGYTCGFY